MSFSGAVTALESILSSAASAVGSYVVMAGEPDLPPDRTITWWYEGDGPNPLIPDTLIDSPYAENVTVRAYVPVAARIVGEPMKDVELELEALARAIGSRLELDRDLGGNCASLTIGDSAAGWLGTPTGGWWRILTLPLSLGFTDLEPITA